MDAAVVKANVEKDGVEENQYLTFLLSGEMFAISIQNIREIMEYGELTTVPMMPDFVRGVINLRGSVVPVVDLSARFGRDKCIINRRSCIVILEVPGSSSLQVIGIIVDAVSEVREIGSEDIEPPPSFGARIRTDFISGMGKVEGRFVVVLDVEQVVNVDEMAQLSRLTRGA